MKSIIQKKIALENKKQTNGFLKFNRKRFFQIKIKEFKARKDKIIQEPQKFSGFSS